MLFFLKKRVKLTLTVLLNVCVSLLLLKINELVRWWRVSREVYKYQEWPVLVIFFFTNNSSIEIIRNAMTWGFKIVFQTPGVVGCSMVAWHLTCLINFLLLRGSDFAGLDLRSCENLTQGMLVLLSCHLSTLPPTEVTLSSTRIHSLNVVVVFLWLVCLFFPHPSLGLCR